MNGFMYFFVCLLFYNCNRESFCKEVKRSESKVIAAIKYQQRPKTNKQSFVLHCKENKLTSYYIAFCSTYRTFGRYSRKVSLLLAFLKRVCNSTYQVVCPALYSLSSVAWSSPSSTVTEWPSAGWS